MSSYDDTEYSAGLHVSKSFTSLGDEEVTFKRNQLGGYLQGNVLGQGSFGVVYEAYHMKDKRAVALKVCSLRKRSTLQNDAQGAWEQAHRE